MFTWQVWSLKIVWNIGNIGPSRKQKLQLKSLGFLYYQNQSGPLIKPNPNTTLNHPSPIKPKTNTRPNPTNTKSGSNGQHPAQNRSTVHLLPHTTQSPYQGGFATSPPSTWLPQLTTYPLHPFTSSHTSLMLPHHHTSNPYTLFPCFHVSLTLKPQKLTNLFPPPLHMSTMH